MTISAPINIFSGETGLGGALTNPTELARKKGCVPQAYSVVFNGRLWPDVETAYSVLAQNAPEASTRDALMLELIAAKFRRYPELLQEVVKRGGREWLMRCSHHTHARTERAQSWEGVGMDSRFIRNLVAGFDLVGQAPTELGQTILF